MKKFKLLITSPFVAMAATAPVMALTSCGGNEFKIEGTKEFQLTKNGKVYTSKGFDIKVPSKFQFSQKDASSYKCKIEVVDRSITGTSQSLDGEPAVDCDFLYEGEITDPKAKTIHVTKVIFTFAEYHADKFTIKCGLKVKILKGTETFGESTINDVKFICQ